MAKLRDIAGCILNEFTQAQHLANTCAARLGREYAENDLLRYFMIPNACAGNLAFSLKFVVNPSEEKETVLEINYSRLIQFFSQLAVSVTETAITTVLYASEGGIVDGTAGRRKLKEKEEELKTDFHEYLSTVLREELVRKAIDEVDADGIPDHNRIFEIAMDVVRRKFLEHSELHLRAEGQESFDEIGESCSSFIGTLIERSCKRMSFLESRQEDVLDVAIDSKTLSETAPENIHQLTFNVNLRNYQISKVDTENGCRDCIIPANG
jgi:hypothetical protein